MVMRKRNSPCSSHSEADELQRLNIPDLAQPPGYAHVVVASGTRSVMTAGAVPLDTQGNLTGAGDGRAQARQTLDNPMRHSLRRPGPRARTS